MLSGTPDNEPVSAIYAKGYALDVFDSRRHCDRSSGPVRLHTPYDRPEQKAVYLQWDANRTALIICVEGRHSRNERHACLVSSGSRPAIGYNGLVNRCLRPRRENPANPSVLA